MSLISPGRHVVLHVLGVPAARVRDDGKGGNTNPQLDQKVNMPPATAGCLPPVMMNAATLFLMSTRLWIVIWFCTQFNGSIIL